MDIVIDTNVLMSGLIWSGVPGRVLEAWSAEKFNAALSMDIIEEYTRVAGILSKKAPEMDLVAEVNKFIRYGKIYNPPILKGQISIDPNDDMFIACALCTDSKIIVSGDSDLLDISKNNGIHVFKPRDFLDNYLPF